MKTKDNKYKKILICITLIMLIFGNYPAKVVHSQPVKDYSKETYDESLTLPKNISFSGVFDSYSWNFNIDKTTKVSSLNLKIKFEVTDVLTKEVGSYLTFYINETEFYSKKIEDEQGKVQELEVSVPIELVREGFNELKISGYLRTSDKPCTDDYNNANWLVLKEGSVINIKKSNIIGGNLIKEFPYPISNVGGYNTTKIIIPDSYSDGELSAALNLQSLIGRFGSESELIKASDAKELERSNLVYIGRVSEIPENLKSEVKDTGDIDNNSFIKLTKSPMATNINEKILYVISNNEEELMSGIKFLMNQELVSQVNGESVYINSKMNLDNKIKEEKKILTLKELGYNEKSVEGLFRNEVNISYALPQNRRLSTGDEININLRYAENLDFNRSLFTIYINDIPVGSKRLSKEKANKDIVQVTIPKDVITTSYVEIKFAFDLLLDNVDCEVNVQKQPWALITEDSFIAINDKQIDQYYFDTYPAPFANDWNMNNTLFVLPDNLLSSELNKIGNMVSYIGKYTKYNLGDLKAISSKNLKDEHKDKNIIVYGTPQNNKLIKDLNKNLWMKYNEEYNKFLSNEKLTLMENFNENIATFQLDVSPYNKQKNMLVLTSPKEKILENSLIYLSDNKEIYKLNGDGAVIDEHGNIRCFKYKEEVKATKYETIKQLNKTSKILLVLISLNAIFIGIAIFLYLNKYNKKGKRTTARRSRRNRKRKI